MKITLLFAVILIALYLGYSKIVNPKLKGDKKKSLESLGGINGTIFYHEDDFCQVEIIPKENFKRLIIEEENVHDFSQKHTDGNGYADIHSREDVYDIKLKQRKISISELNQVLSQLSLEKHIIVSTGITPNEMISENTIGYGENYQGVFFDFDEDIVSNIWVSGLFNKSKLINVLNEMGVKWDLILMDWNSLELIDLTQKEQVKRYVE